MTAIGGTVTPAERAMSPLAACTGSGEEGGAGRRGHENVGDVNRVVEVRYRLDGSDEDGSRGLNDRDQAATGTPPSLPPSSGVLPASTMRGRPEPIRREGPGILCSLEDHVEPNLTPAEARAADPDRLVFLTDGVIAIIMTILVLDIRVPELGSGQSLADSLVEARPTFVSFVISFLLVGMFWTMHKRTFSRVRYVDHNLTWLNLLFLLSLAVMPYASSALGRYHSEPIALHLYGVVMISASLLYLALSSYVHTHPGLLWEKATGAGHRHTVMMSWGTIAVYAIAMLAATWNTTVSLILFFSIPFLYFAAVAFVRSDERIRRTDDLA